MADDRAALRQRLERVFREVFDDDELQLRDDLTAADVDGWDSLTHITPILSVEREFGVKLAAARIARLKNAGELLDLLVARQSS